MSWLVLVFLFYLFYGRKHATLSHYKHEDEIAEPIGPEYGEDIEDKRKREREHQ